MGATSRRPWARAVLACAVAAIPLLPAATAGREPQAPGAQRPAAPQRAAGVTPTGTGVVTVTVTAGDDAAASKNAAVYLVGLFTTASGPSQPARNPGAAVVAGVAPRDGVYQPIRRAARTAGGVATFTEVPAGEYLVNVVPPPGFLQVEPTPQRVQVANGGQASATVRIVRGGVITGRVTDEDGDPMTGVSVTVFRAEKNGGPRPTHGGSQPSNDLGIYRVWGLSAGEYLVSAWAQDAPSPVGEGAYQDGYVPSYYPGVAAVDAARTVAVRTGQETGAVDITMLRGRMGTVSGRVIDSQGTYAGPGGPSATAELSPRTMNPVFGARGSGVRNDGTFVITGVPAGEYYLSAHVTRGTGATAVREAGIVPISVNGDEVSATIQTNPGATVSGRVVIEGIPPAVRGGPGAISTGQNTGSPTYRVFARQATPEGRSSSGFSTGSGSTGAVRPDGSFQLGGLRGPIQLTAVGPAAALKSVFRGATDLSGQVLDLVGNERVDDVVVTLTYDTGSLRVTVASSGDDPPTAGTVAVFPDDPDKWGIGSPFVRLLGYSAASRTAGGGGASAPGLAAAGQPLEEGTVTFQVSALPAGRYVVAALAEVNLSGNVDPKLLERWRENGKLVTVDAGQTASVRLTATK